MVGVTELLKEGGVNFRVKIAGGNDFDGEAAQFFLDDLELKDARHIAENDGEADKRDAAAIEMEQGAADLPKDLAEGGQRDFSARAPAKGCEVAYGIANEGHLAVDVIGEDELANVAERDGELVIIENLDAERVGEDMMKPGLVETLERDNAELYGAVSGPDMRVREGSLDKCALTGIETMRADAENEYDFVIETLISDEALPAIVRALRPGGLLVIKSRNHKAVQFPVGLMLERELRLECVRYGSFDEALQLLARSTDRIAHIMRETYPLECFEEAFEAARESECKKIFISID